MLIYYKGCLVWYKMFKDEHNPIDVFSNYLRTKNESMMMELILDYNNKLFSEICE